MSAVEDLIKKNPFPGLRSFKPEEADQFFGREQQIDDLVARLAEAPLVAVAGASGCGKSSLVLAGLLNRLATLRLAGGNIEWRPVRLRPGNQPITNLATSLAAVLHSDAADDDIRVGLLEGQLRLGGLGLAEVAQRARLEPHARLLVVVDQFEEIFRFKEMTDPEEATAFVKLLLNAAAHPDSCVRVVLTLRSNALGSCADFRDLPEAINRGLYLVPRLTWEQRKEAIVKPVELRGFQIAPRLVQRILNDVTDSFDELPVMQHVLAQTWRYWARNSEGTRPIDLDDYEATGTARIALSNHANEAHESLTDLPDVVKRVFRALTEQVANEVQERRPLEFERLCAVVGREKADVARVVERFHHPDTAFLMLSPEEATLDANPVVDISHESLIRQWERLHTWAEEEAESRTMLLGLVDAARRHEAGEGELWRGRDLKKAKDWLDRERPTAAWISLCTGGDGVAIKSQADNFISSSEKARKGILFRELLLIVGVSTVVGAVITHMLQKQVSSRALSNQAQLALNYDSVRAARYAFAAMDQDPENRGGEFALRNSLAKLEIAHVERIIEFDKPISDARLSSDKSRIVVAAGKEVTILDAKSYEKIGKPFSREQDVDGAWLIANNGVLVTKTGEAAQVQRVNEAQIHSLSCPDKEDSIYTLAVSDDGRYIGTGCLKGEISVWELKGSEPPRKFKLASSTEDEATVTALSFSSDSEYLASGDAGGDAGGNANIWKLQTLQLDRLPQRGRDADGNANIWKLGESEPWIGAKAKGAQQSPIRHKKAIRDIAFYPGDPELLATASDDRTAFVWKLDLQQRRLVPEKPGEKQKWTRKHDRPVVKAKFAPRGTETENPEYPLITVSDKRVRIWVQEDSREARPHDDWVEDVSASEDGELAVSASNDGTAQIWWTRSGAPVAVLRGHRNAVLRAFFGTEGRVVTAGLDGQLRIWKVRPPKKIFETKGKWVLGIAFDADHKNVAWCGEVLGEKSNGQCRIHSWQDAGGDPVEPKELKRVEDADQIELISFSADGGYLLGHKARHDIFDQTTPVLWDTASRKIVTPSWLENWTTASFSAARSELVTVDQKDGRVAVWDATVIGKPNPNPELLLLPKSGRWWAELSPDGRWVAVIEDREVALIDRRSPKSAPRMLQGHQGSIKTVKFSRDSQRLVTASADRTARVWQVHSDPNEARQSVLLAGGHTGALAHAAFDLAGTRVVTSSADGTIRVWDAHNGSELAVLSQHSDSVNQAEFDSDGKGILSASDDGLVVLGRCESCSQEVSQLRERVLKEAILPRDELAAIQEDIRIEQPFFKRLALVLWPEP
jgi:WD40 repeat protein